MPTATDVLNLARSQIGIGENPMGSNSGTPYHAWYGAFSQGWQWCAIYVSWVIWHVDPDLQNRLKTAYSGDSLTWGRRHGREIDISQIAPGDICIWDRPVGGITDHIGFVESVTPTTFTTIEGNSGDCVKRNANRPRVQTSACHYYFVRPNYSSTPTPPKKPQEDDEMILAELGKAALVPSFATDSMKCYLDFSNQANVVSKIRLSARRDTGDRTDPGWSALWTKDILEEGTMRIEVGKDLKLLQGVTIKVEVLGGGPVLVVRKQTV